MKYRKPSHVTYYLAITLVLVLSIGICGQPTLAGGPWSQQDPEVVLPSSVDEYDEQKVVAPDGAEGDGFGYAVAISDDGSTALVGTFNEYDYEYPVGPGDVYVIIREGPSWVFQQKLVSPPMPDSDLFGYSVALSADGNTALVGARGSAGPIALQVPGAAFVFTRSDGNWSQQAVLTATARAVGDFFGISVALSDSGNTAMIGAYGDDIGASANQGSVYVFERNGVAWSQQAQLTASDGAAGDGFGRSVSLASDGNSAIIGSVFDDVGVTGEQGSAYIFTRSGTIWSQQAQLISSNGAQYDRFGLSVAISGDGNTALIGAQNHDVGPHPKQGAAYVFIHDGTTWSQQAELTARDGEGGDYFGDSVALSFDGSAALVGVHWDKNPSSGSVYTFAQLWEPIWVQSGHIIPSDGGMGDEFGFAVALSADGSRAVIGSKFDDIGENGDRGSAYFYTIPAYHPLSIYLPLGMK